MKYSSINLKSEEDVKIKVIIPFLKDMGFNFDELDFETSLSFVFGTRKHEIDGKYMVRGRIDILCKTDGRNLFVLEVKKDDKKIDMDDIEQAISYAKLVHPIAPFAIISNGKSTQIYNVFTKTEIKDKRVISSNPIWKGNLSINIDEELRLRYEALKNFIGYSLENVQLFTQRQVEQRMHSLFGDKNDLSKKFIPGLFVGRINLYREFESFINSDDKCFAIVGESGVGKTNCICDLVFRISQNNIVLFFNGTFLYETLIDSIKSDFNWIFSQHLETIEIIRRLDGLTDKNNYKILIFVDAIDEVKTPNFELELNDLIQKIINLPKIKICFTCKTYDWARFETIKGQPSHIKEYLFNKKSFSLEKFNELEISEVDNKYREAFKYSGVLTEELRSEVNLGIMFRILSEIYEGKELPNKFNELELFNAYLQKKVEKMESEISHNILKEIGKIIIQNDIEFEVFKFTGIVEENLLRIKLNIPLNDKLFPEFFSHNILFRYEQEKGEKHIGFYYNRFKDYVIAVLSYNLPSLSGEKFKEILQELMKGQNGQESILWYINVASNEQLQIMYQYYFERAEVFINCYNEILNKKLNLIKEKFDPLTKGEIGILITDDLKFDMLSYAFRKIDIRKDKYAEVIKKNNFKHDTLFMDYDAKIIRTSRYNFMTISPTRAAVDEILKQLEEIVGKEKLNEINNKSLALEKIQSILYYYSEKFGYDKINYLHKTPYIKPLLPIDIAALSKKLKINLAKIYIADQRFSEMEKKGKISLDAQEYEEIFNKDEIESEALELIKGKKEFSIERSGLEGTLYKYLNVLLKNKNDLINKPYLPFPDLSEKEAYDRSMKLSGYFSSPSKIYYLYSEEQLKNYILQFFETFIEEYKIIIETNFNSIKNLFYLYSCLPIHYYAHINLGGMGIEHGFKRSKTGENCVEVRVIDSISDLGKDKDMLIISYQSLEIFFNQFTTPLSGIDLDEICPLRGFLYGKLRDEIKKVIRKLKNDSVNL